MKYLFLLLIPVFLLSCQREVDEQLPEENTVSTSVKEILVIDTTQLPGADTIARITITHDQQARIEKVYVDELANQMSQSSEFRYRGNDKSPYLAISILTDVTDIIKDSTFFTYENGIVKKDTTVSYEKVPVIQQDFRLQMRIATTFTRTGNTVRVQRTKYHHAPGGQMFDETTDDNFTILSEGPYFYNYTTNNYHYNIKLSTVLDPFKGVPRYPVFQQDWAFAILGAYDYLPESLDMQENLYGQHASFTFQTRPDGYPAIMWEKNLDSGSIIKWVFKY